MRKLLFRLRLSLFAGALYVGVVVYGTPQDWLRGALLFGVAMCINV